MLEWLIGLFLLFIIVGLVYLLMALSQEINRQKEQKKSGKVNLHRNQSKSQSSNLVNISRLESKLINLVGGQRDTAKRLVNNIKTKNPNKDELWCLEKVIEDLERDRQ